MIPAGNKAKRLSSVNHSTKNNSSSSAPSMQQKNYILVAFKVYLDTTIVSAHGYSGIFKYLKIHIRSISPSVLQPELLPFDVCSQN